MKKILSIVFAVILVFSCIYAIKCFCDGSIDQSTYSEIRKIQIEYELASDDSTKQALKEQFVEKFITLDDMEQKGYKTKVKEEELQLKEIEREKNSARSYLK